jgi:hypothetical protein
MTYVLLTRERTPIDKDDYVGYLTGISTGIVGPAGAAGAAGAA